MTFVGSRLREGVLIVVLVPELAIVDGDTTGRDLLWRSDGPGAASRQAEPAAHDRRYAWGRMRALDEVLGAIRRLPLSERLSEKVDSSAERDAVVGAALASPGVSVLDDRLRSP
jgi:hypothetical protein